MGDRPTGPLGIEPLQFSLILFGCLLLFVLYLLLPRGLRVQYFHAYPKRYAWSARTRARRGRGMLQVRDRNSVPFAFVCRCVVCCAVLCCGEMGIQGGCNISPPHTLCIGNRGMKVAFILATFTVLVVFAHRQDHRRDHYGACFSCCDHGMSGFCNSTTSILDRTSLSSSSSSSHQHHWITIVGSTPAPSPTPTYIHQHPHAHTYVHRHLHRYRALPLGLLPEILQLGQPVGFIGKRRMECPRRSAPTAR